MKTTRGDHENAAAQVLKSLPHCVSLIVEFQNGVYGDLRDRFQERYKPLTVFLERKPNYKRGQKYLWPADCRPLGCMSKSRIIPMRDLFLYENVRDRRFALHLAIAEGEQEIVERICRMNPLLGTKDAFKCAVRFNRVEMMELFFPCLDKKDLAKLPFRDVGEVTRKSLQKKTLQKLDQLGFVINNLQTLPLLLRVADNSALGYLHERLGAELAVEQLIWLLEDAVKRRVGFLVDRILHQLLRQQEEFNDSGLSRYRHWLETLG